MKTKKHKKFTAKILTTAMVLLLSMGTVTTVFAETPPEGMPQSPATASIVKELQMPKGTTVPTATFEFNIEKVSFDGSTSEAAKNSMPALSGKVNISSDSYADSGDVRSASGQTGDLLSGKTWTSAGEYVYKVTETKDTYSIADVALEKMTYSKAEFELHVYIAEGPDGSLYVKSAVVYQKLDDEGKTTATGGGGATADIPSTSYPKIDPSKPITGNNFKFTNTYVKTMSDPGKEPTTTNQSLVISKAVTGDMASTSREFTFAIKLTNNSLVDTASYTGKICTLSGGTYTKVPGTDDITFTPGTSQNVNLKHGQYLVFTGLPVGTTWEATEAAVSGYAPSAHVVVDGTAVTPDLGGTTNTNIELATGEKLLGEGTNSAAFTNTAISTIPTGLIFENLPYITMLLLGVGAFGIFVLSKRKRAR